MKHVIRIVLLAVICLLGYLTVDSVVTPIRFEETRKKRENAITKNLINIRTAELEFRSQKGYFTADFDSLITFLKTTPKKEVLKEGSLTDAQLEAGLTEEKAVKIINTACAKAAKRLDTDNIDDIYVYIWANDKDIIDNKLIGFRRDTVNKNMLEELYHGAITAENVADIAICPFSDGERFILEVNNDYKTSQGIRVPLFQCSAPFEMFLADQDKQELANLKDKEIKVEHFPGLRVGDITAPNNNAGNWE